MWTEQFYPYDSHYYLIQFRQSLIYFRKQKPFSTYRHMCALFSVFAVCCVCVMHALLIYRPKYEWMFCNSCVMGNVKLHHMNKNSQLLSVYVWIYDLWFYVVCVYVFSNLFASQNGERDKMTMSWRDEYSSATIMRVTDWLCALSTETKYQVWVSVCVFVILCALLLLCVFNIAIITISGTCIHYVHAGTFKTATLSSLCALNCLHAFCTRVYLFVCLVCLRTMPAAKILTYLMWKVLYCFAHLQSCLSTQHSPAHTNGLLST